MTWIHIQQRTKHLCPNDPKHIVVVLFFSFLFFFIINALGRPYWCVGHFFTQINYLFQKYFRDWTINQLINFSSDSSILSLINPCFWKGTHQYVSQLLFRFINIIPCQYVFFATAVSISLSIIIPLHYPLSVRFFCNGHINQLINYYSLSTRFLGEGRINQLINYYSASSILSVINPFFWRGTHQSTYQLLFRFINIIPYQSVFFGEGHINQLINYYSASSILFLINPFFLARDTSISLSIILSLHLNYPLSILFLQGPYQSIISKSSRYNSIFPLFFIFLIYEPQRFVYVSLGLSTDFKIQQRNESWW